jgi:hypothetical protein
MEAQHGEKDGGITRDLDASHIDWVTIHFRTFPDLPALDN